jgi:hypothetical protein
MPFETLSLISRSEGHGAVESSQERVWLSSGTRFPEEVRQVKALNGDNFK